jgi:hypothetical protein
LEVTWLVAPRAQQLTQLVAREALSWPLPGHWHWTAGIRDPRALPRLRDCFAEVVLWCEGHGLQRPEQWWAQDGDDVPGSVRWAAEAPVTLLGHPDIPAVDETGRRLTAWLTEDATGFMVDHGFAGLSDTLTSAFTEGHLPGHVAKLLDHPDVDERHLYLPVHLTGLPDQLSDALMTGTTMPPEPPPLPEGLTHLWLAHHFGQRLLLGTAEGWTEHHPYNL